MSSDLASTGQYLTVRRSPRAKALRLRVDPRLARVVLTVPRTVSERRALEWAAQHRAWIEQELAALAPAEPLQPGSIVPLYGQPHVLIWHPSGPRALRLEDDRLVGGGPADMLGLRLLRWLRQHAAQLLEEESRQCAAKAGVSIANVGVGDPISRWGSCSASGAIRYSWRLILAPAWVRRATVAHEVAHRVHMNHGSDFHALVARLLGSDPNAARAWLRRHGPSLHRFGRN